jgi:hypothetical protein
MYTGQLSKKLRKIRKTMPPMIVISASKIFMTIP